MNFIKNTWKNLLNKQGQNKQNPQQKPSQQSTQPQTVAQEPQKPQGQQKIPPQILQQLFTLSAQLIKQSKKVTNDQTKLKIYSLFKQAKEGDCHTEKPAMFDFIGKSKWAAWNQLRGMTKEEAMMQYVRVVGEADPQIIAKIGQHFDGAAEGGAGNQAVEKSVQNSTGMGYKKVQKVDYSNQYSHPYFKPIQKDQQIPKIQHAQLLIKNNSPSVYPLHFAIDKQRVDLVKAFLEMLSVPEIESMVDEEGTGILQYAELIENQEILELVRGKIGK